MAILVLLNRDQDVPRRLFRDRSNPLDYLSDDAVISDYRLDRRTIYYGGYMSVIGEAHGVSKMTVSRTIKTFTGLITLHLDKYITFPMDIPEQLKVKRDFYNIRGFPSVLGAVDGTLIPIETPSIDEYHYVCRKGFHALNIQGVCDAKLKFLNIVAKWPGTTHDLFIWTNCGLSAAFEDKEITGGWLLGDSGYGLRPWLLTSKLNPRTPADRKYNVCHKSTRCVIERAFGL
ncbi:putative nuclease HARBI1 [Ylistrum balloti]|uniref:putative nuclease HARBI1 n=1 Tax=Ylistrum balloti TaxID=509963 RepID=UPI002905A291|nr:putative nuclease HARBI1 [Ylistrum balloti]